MMCAVMSAWWVVEVCCGGLTVGGGRRCVSELFVWMCVCGDEWTVVSGWWCVAGCGGGLMVGCGVCCVSGCCVCGDWCVVMRWRWCVDECGSGVGRVWWEWFAPLPLGS